MYAILSAIAYGVVTFRLIVRGKNFVEGFILNFGLLVAVFANFIYSGVVLSKCLINLC
jgi:hypothetical protein